MPFYEDYGFDFAFAYFPAPYPGTMPAMHLHPHYEALLILDRVSASVCINTFPLELEQPFLQLCAPFCLHYANFPKGAPIDRTVFYFGEKMLTDYAQPLGKLNAYREFASTVFLLSEGQARELRQLQRYVLEKSERPEQQRLLFLLMLNAVLDDTPEERIIRSPATTNYINSVIRYLNEHYVEQVSLEELANAFFVSRSKLCHDFKSYTGKTVHQILLEIRISRALYIIRFGAWSSIGDVAAQVGFGNGFHFYSVFKKTVGVSPRQYAEGFHAKPRKTALPQ